MLIQYYPVPVSTQGGGLESHCVGRVCGADVAVRTAHTTYAVALTHPKTQCRKPHGATQHLMVLMMGVCTRNMSS